MIVATARDIERFLANVVVLDSGCMFWNGARSKGKGNRLWYGSIHTENHGTVRAHRFSSEVFNGDECPKGYHRDHTCNFSLCVNPDHIEVIPKRENECRKQKRSSRRLLPPVIGSKKIATGARHEQVGRPQPPHPRRRDRQRRHLHP